MNNQAIPSEAPASRRPRSQFLSTFEQLLWKPDQKTRPTLPRAHVEHNEHANAPSHARR